MDQAQAQVDRVPLARGKVGSFDFFRSSLCGLDCMACSVRRPSMGRIAH